ncbi:hypothetical protein [Labedaea rhizosphaerae]|uniref:DUF3558 domain-containing protein n=1 Tax=Labedaea rhizosphaerae TaxID=598644 RepID=A0A4R6SHH0_LABRH|nr:hypothetical protein [Labedaea rhizosphaerae]TDQ01073.1 hypothetical protein EV186_102940 [Labedaea rhizosphaerae]
MVRVVAGLCAAVLALAACSSKADDPAPVSTGAPGSVLTKITEQQACDLLDSATIKKALDVEPGIRDSRRVGKAPITVTYMCNYHTGVPGLSTDVATTRADRSDKQVLDGAFTDRATENAAPGKYEQVPGVGVLAGFGPDATMSGGGLTAHKLAVVFRAGSERLALEVSVLGDATLAQLKPLALELVAKLQAAIGK